MEMTATAVLTMAARPVPHLAGLARGSLNLAVLVKRCGCGCCSRACRCFVPRFPARSILSLAAHMRPDTYVRTHTTAHTCPLCTHASHVHVRAHLFAHACPHMYVHTRISAHTRPRPLVRTRRSRTHICTHMPTYTRLRTHFRIFLALGRLGCV